MGGQTRDCGSPAYRVKLPLRDAGRKAHPRRGYLGDRGKSQRGQAIDLLDRKMEFGFAPFAAVFTAVQSAAVRRAFSTATGITSSNSDRSNSDLLSIV